MNDEGFMALALDEAAQAAADGEVPVGAVVIRLGRVVATGRNAQIAGNDPTAHAEILALRAAALALGNYRLDDCELFVTLEPCAMCSGALLNARLKRVVFGAQEPKTGAAGSVVNLFSQPQLNHQTQLLGGVLAAQSRALLQDFFRQRRADQRQLCLQGHPLRDDALRTPDAAFADIPGYPWRPHYVSDLPSLDGLRMHYLDEQSDAVPKDGGQALTYLCLHDSSTWSYAFRNLIPFLLKAGDRVIAPDLIGFGKSDKPKKEIFHTFCLHREILLELVEKLELQNIVLVLTGQVGSLGLTLPAAAPERYCGLRMLDDVVNADVILPLTEGFRVLQAAAEKYSGKQVKPLTFTGDWRAKAEMIAAFEAPFPSNSYRAAMRAFSAAGWGASDDDVPALTSRAEQFWRQRKSAI